MRGLAGALAILLAAILWPAAAGAHPGVTTRVSVSSAGTQANGLTFNQVVFSADGRFVVFPSAASNLVDGDTNACGGVFSVPGCPDVFLHDRITGVTTRVSVDSAGAQGNDASIRGVVSGDGRFVAFESLATNLVPGDTNGQPDVFVHDRLTGATTRVNVSSSGEQANGVTLSPRISADGRYVAFNSAASNLVPEDGNGAFDVFVHDRLTAVTTRVSVGSLGEEGNGDSVIPDISADGRYVAFSSVASNLVPGPAGTGTQVYVHDRQTGTTSRVSVDGSGTPASGASFNGGISADGRAVVFVSNAGNLVADDTNGFRDVFVHDRQTGTTTRANVDSAGVQANGFSNLSFNGNGQAISADGRWVTFQSEATNLVVGDTNGLPDVFLHDRVTGATVRVSVDSAGVPGNGGSGGASVSADGRLVGFISGATNLVTADTNSTFDAFLHDRGDPADRIGDLIALVESFDLPPGTETSLRAKLEAARAAANAGDTATACATLAGFVHEVEAQSGKKLTEAEAARLVAAAIALREALGC